MGGKITGKRVMLTVPQAILADLEGFAEHMDLPLSSAIRALLEEMHPIICKINEALVESKKGNIHGLVNVQAIMTQAQAELLQQQAAQYREISEFIEKATKGAKT